MTIYKGIIFGHFPSLIWLLITFNIWNEAISQSEQLARSIFTHENFQENVGCLTPGVGSALLQGAT